MKANFLKKLNLKMYESNRALGNFGPVPYGSVELSNQMEKLLKNSSNSLKISEENAYLNYRFGKIHSANFLYKTLLSQKKDGKQNVTFLMLGLAVTASLQRDYAESNEILSFLAKSEKLNLCERRAIKYWQCRNYLGLISYEALEKIFEAISPHDASWFLVELYLKSSKYDSKFAIKQLKKWNLQNDNSYTCLKCLFKLDLLKETNIENLFYFSGFSLDHHTMVAFLDRFGINKFLNNWRKTIGKVPHTSEIIASISLFSIKNGGPKIFCEFYNSNKIKFLGNVQISKMDREQLVYDSITYQDGIRDFNTSNFGGRTYTLDLSKSTKFSFQNIKKIVEDKFKKSQKTISENLNEILRPRSLSLDTWFDASFTSGGSNIFPHLHTGGLGKTYYFTAVYYAQIPSDMQEGEGNLIFSKTDIANKKYEKTSISTRIKVKTGDLYIFPSYMFHSTTPSFTKQVRLTFNFDFWSKKTFLKI